MSDSLAKKYVPAGFHAEGDSNVVSFAVSAEQVIDVCRTLYRDRGLELKTIFAADERAEKRGFVIRYVFGAPNEGFVVPFLSLAKAESFPSVAPFIHEASLYERKIRTFFGLVPEGHPDLRPLILHEHWPADLFPLRKDFREGTRPKAAHGSYPFFKVEGEGVYEIPVGPVHAGIIEPGHFRFSVVGEEIVRLEAKLGYVHKGIEKLFESSDAPGAVKLAERVSGDTSFTHALAFCQALETLSGIDVPERAKYLRVIFSELERLANHLNDIGFIMLDTGFSFGGANGARLRELVMRTHERLSGSRYLRGVAAVGGVAVDIAPEAATELASTLAKLEKDFNEVMAIADDSSSLKNRLEGTGVLERQVALDHGVVGVAARAAGIKRDARTEYPYAAYGALKHTTALETSGDVEARFRVRVKEVRASFALIQEALAALPKGEIRSDKKPAFKKNALALGIAEGWRGEIVYAVLTDSAGALTRVEVRDPSFLNWSAVGYAVKGNVVPDFPLINKSFNLSYSGNDL
ncbi:MAG: NADH-quinone oxidoreductase subunit C [Patescibacteria group bacterium]|nr:NADH-quinone oxidoreductase subunit C [Patescibacteria group bacterium]